MHVPRLGLSELGFYAEAQGVEVDEAGGVGLIVGLGGVGLHCCDMWVVEALWAAAACGNEVAFIQLEAHGTGYVFLGFGDEGLQGFPFGGEPEAVVDEGAVFGDERVA